MHALDDHVPNEPAVAPLSGEEYVRHTARGDLPDELIATDAFPHGESRELTRRCAEARLC